MEKELGAFQKEKFVEGLLRDEFPNNWYGVWAFLPYGKFKEIDRIEKRYAWVSKSALPDDVVSKMKKYNKIVDSSNELLCKFGNNGGIEGMIKSPEEIQKLKGLTLEALNLLQGGNPNNGWESYIDGVIMEINEKKEAVA